MRIIIADGNVRHKNAAAVTQHRNECTMFHRNTVSTEQCTGSTASAESLGAKAKVQEAPQTHLSEDVP